MEKEEYKRFTARISTKHLKFPSGLEIDVIIPRAVEMIDVLVRGGIDVEELFKKVNEIQKKAVESEEKEEIFFEPTIWKANKILMALIKDTDGEQVSEYVRRDDYQYLSEVARSFFSGLPSLKSLKEQQNSSKKDTKPSDSGPMISST